MKADKWAELRAAEAAATPGPWTDEDAHLVCSDTDIVADTFRDDADAETVVANARLIALARSAVPALLAERDELRAALQDVLRWTKTCGYDCEQIKLMEATARAEALLAEDS